MNTSVTHLANFTFVEDEKELEDLESSILDMEGAVKFEARESDLDTIECIVISIISLLLQTCGNAMLIGMILYEVQGNGDPLKRRIVDQVRIQFFL